MDLKRAPTLMDVATRAGVSYATVDRVMNGRGRVAEKSRASVMRAVDDLGYVRNVAAANLSQRRVYRFCFVIPEGTNAFFDHMCRIVGAIKHPAGADRIQLRIERVAAFDADALVACLDSVTDADLDGIAIVGIDDSRIATRIAKLRDKGIGVLTIISDMAGSRCDGYIGINNATAGATAGGLIAISQGGQPGRVMPIIGALTARDHAERLEGFRKTLAASALTIAPLIEGRDRHDVVEARVRAALIADPAITAIYSAGAGNAGLIRVLADLPSHRPRPMVVLHELVPHSRDALEQGLIDIVIDQRPEEEIMQALAMLRCLADRQPLPEVRQIVPAIYIRENLPAEINSILLEGAAA